MNIRGNIVLSWLIHEITLRYDTHWRDGRQGTGYSIFSLIPTWVNRTFRIDVILIRMKQGVEIPPHFDHVPIIRKIYGYRVHNRLNVLIRKPSGGGGEFYINALLNEHTDDDDPIYEQVFPNQRIVRFSPSSVEHGVTKIESGTRYVLSFGWLSR